MKRWNNLKVLWFILENLLILAVYWIGAIMSDLAKYAKSTQSSLKYHPSVRFVNQLFTKCLHTTCKQSKRLTSLVKYSFEKEDTWLINFQRLSKSYRSWHKSRKNTSRKKMLAWRKNLHRRWGQLCLPLVLANLRSKATLWNPVKMMVTSRSSSATNSEVVKRAEKLTGRPAAVSQKPALIIECFLIFLTTMFLKGSKLYYL